MTEPTPYAAPSPVPPPATKQALSLTSFIIGIAAFVFGLVPFFGFILALPAIIIGFIARRKEATAPKWMSLVGIITGFVAAAAGVLVAILLLGSIAIPIALGQQAQASDVAAKSDLENARIAVISAAMAGNGTYPTTAAELTPYGYVPSDGVGTVTIISATTQGMCLSAISPSGTTLYITATGSASTTRCN
jgi:hypothetical protein